jgi:hypothetical protein
MRLRKNLIVKKSQVKVKKKGRNSHPPQPVFPEEGDGKGLEWALNDDGSLDLAIED